MSCNTDLIICLWMVPVVSFLLLPLALAAVALPFMYARRAFSESRAVTTERREEPRLSSSAGSVAKVTVGDTTVTALVSDISQTGICLKHLPEMFSYKISKMPIVVRQFGVDYNLLVKAKWTELTESGKKLGAEIETASPGWNQLLLETAKA